MKFPILSNERPGELVVIMEKSRNALSKKYRWVQGPTLSGDYCGTRSPTEDNVAVSCCGLARVVSRRGDDAIVEPIPAEQSEAVLAEHGYYYDEHGKLRHEMTDTQRAASRAEYESLVQYLTPLVGETAMKAYLAGELDEIPLSTLESIEFGNGLSDRQVELLQAEKP